MDSFNRLLERADLSGFWATVRKTVRPMLSDRCLSCLSVCNVGVLVMLVKCLPKISLCSNTQRPWNENRGAPTSRYVQRRFVIVDRTFSSVLHRWIEAADIPEQQ